jgi:hypothetical protein
MLCVFECLKLYPMKKTRAWSFSSCIFLDWIEIQTNDSLQRSIYRFHNNLIAPSHASAWVKACALCYCEVICWANLRWSLFSLRIRLWAFHSHWQMISRSLYFACLTMPIASEFTLSRKKSNHYRLNHASTIQTFGLHLRPVYEISTLSLLGVQELIDFQNIARWLMPRLPRVSSLITRFIHCLISDRSLEVSFWKIICFTNDAEP